jgi:hypothetical protein
VPKRKTGVPYRPTEQANLAILALLDGKRLRLLRSGKGSADTVHLATAGVLVSEGIASKERGEGLARYLVLAKTGLNRACNVARVPDRATPLSYRLSRILLGICGVGELEEYDGETVYCIARRIGEYDVFATKLGAEAMHESDPTVCYAPDGSPYYGCTPDAPDNPLATVEQAIAYLDSLTPADVASFRPL